MSGWIKIYRGIQKHWIWDDPIYLKGWLTILMNVNYEDKKVLVDSTLMECKAGEAIYSLRSWTKILGKGWTIRKTRTFLTLLKNDNMIVTKGMRKATRLTVCNYELYQFTRQADDKQTTSRRQADDKQTTTTKEYKEYKEEEEKMRAHAREAFFNSGKESKEDEKRLEEEMKLFWQTLEEEYSDQ